METKFKQYDNEKLNKVINALNKNGQGDTSVAKELIAERDRRLNQSSNATQKPATTSFDLESRKKMLNNMFDSRYSSGMADLRNKRNQALTGLTKMETTASQNAYDSRNQADVVNTQNVSRLNERMAKNGLMFSGENLTNQAALAGQRQSALSNINRDKNNILSDIAERRNTINNNYYNDIRGLRSQIDSDRIKSIMDLDTYADQANFRNSQFNYQQNRDAIADDRYEDERDWSRSEDNPAVQAQTLSNKINQLRLQNLPQQLQLELTNLQQAVQNGSIDIQQAQYQLEQLMDPNSTYNQQQRLNLEAQKQILYENTDNANTADVPEQELRNFFMERVAAGDGAAIIEFWNTNEDLIKQSYSKELYNEMKRKVEEAKQAFATFY